MLAITLALAVLAMLNVALSAVLLYGVLRADVGADAKARERTEP